MILRWMPRPLGLRPRPEQPGRTLVVFLRYAGQRPSADFEMGWSQATSQVGLAILILGSPMLFPISSHPKSAPEVEQGDGIKIPGDGERHRMTVGPVKRTRPIVSYPCGDVG